MKEIRFIRAGELASVQLPVAVSFAGGFRLIDEIKHGIIPGQIEKTASLFHMGNLVGHFYHSTEIRIIENPTSEYSADCPACLRGRLHSQALHDAAVRRAKTDEGEL